MLNNYQLTLLLFTDKFNRLNFYIFNHVEGAFNLRAKWKSFNKKDEKFVVVVVVLPSAVFAVVVGFTFVFVLATIAEVASIANAKV
jgi:hypothetical protein